MDVKLPNRFDHLRALLTRMGELEQAGVPAKPLDEEGALALARSDLDVRAVDPLAAEFAPVTVKAGELRGQVVENLTTLRKLVERAAAAAGVKLLPSADAQATNLAAVTTAEHANLERFRSALATHVAGLLSNPGSPQYHAQMFVEAVSRERDTNGLTGSARAALDAAYGDLALKQPAIAEKLVEELKTKGKVPFRPSAGAVNAARIRELSAPAVWLASGDSRGLLIRTIETINDNTALDDPSRTRIFEAAHGHLLDAGAPSQAHTLATETRLEREPFAAADRARAADGVSTRLLASGTALKSPDIRVVLPALLAVVPELGVGRAADAIAALLTGYVHRASKTGFESINAADVEQVGAVAAAVLPAPLQVRLGETAAAAIQERLRNREPEIPRARFIFPAVAAQALARPVMALLSASDQAGGGAEVAAALDAEVTATLMAHGREALLGLVAHPHGGGGREQLWSGDLGWLHAYVDRGAIAAEELAAIAGVFAAAQKDQNTSTHQRDLAKRLGALVQNVAIPVIAAPSEHVAHVDLRAAFEKMAVRGESVDFAVNHLFSALARPSMGGVSDAMFFLRAAEEAAQAAAQHQAQKSAPVVRGAAPRRLPIGELARLIQAEMVDAVERALGCKLPR